MRPSDDSDPNRPIANSAMPSAAARDSRLQGDPEMQEGPATASRIAMYAAAIAIVIGAVLYGMSAQSPGPAGTAQSTPPATTADSSGGTSSPNIRDVSPNREPGTTTGSASAQPQPPKSKPTGTEVDQNKGSATR